MEKRAIGLTGLLAYTSISGVYAVAGDCVNAQLECGADQLNARSDRIGAYTHRHDDRQH